MRLSLVLEKGREDYFGTPRKAGMIYLQQQMGTDELLGSLKMSRKYDETKTRT